MRHDWHRDRIIDTTLIETILAKWPKYVSPFDDAELSQTLKDLENDKRRTREIISS